MITPPDPSVWQAPKKPDPTTEMSNELFVAHLNGIPAKRSKQHATELNGKLMFDTDIMMGEPNV